MLTINKQKEKTGIEMQDTEQEASHCLPTRTACWFIPSRKRSHGLTIIIRHTC